MHCFPPQTGQTGTVAAAAGRPLSLLYHSQVCPSGAPPAAPWSSRFRTLRPVETNGVRSQARWARRQPLNSDWRRGTRLVSGRHDAAKAMPRGPASAEGVPNVHGARARPSRWREAREPERRRGCGGVSGPTRNLSLSHRTFCRLQFCHTDSSRVCESFASGNSNKTWRMH